MKKQEQIITEIGLLSQMAYQNAGKGKFGIGNIVNDFEDEGKIYKLNSKYRVVDYADNNGTDMQALLLERGEINGNGEFQGSGNYMLAFRGTKGKVDIASSICKDIFVKRTCKFEALSEII